MSRIIMPGQIGPTDLEIVRDLQRVAQYGTYNGMATAIRTWRAT
jgi:hypothetical protein